jgi:hypothetical protein
MFDDHTVHCQNLLRFLEHSPRLTRLTCWSSTPLSPLPWLPTYTLPMLESADLWISPAAEKAVIQILSLCSTTLQHVWFMSAGSSLLSWLTGTSSCYDNHSPRPTRLRSLTFAAHHFTVDGHSNGNSNNGNGNGNGGVGNDINMIERLIAMCTELRWLKFSAGPVLDAVQKRVDENAAAAATSSSNVNVASPTAATVATTTAGRSLSVLVADPT